MMFSLAAFFMTPSAAFLVFGNFPIYILCNLFMIAKLSNFQDKEEMQRLLVAEPFRLVSIYVLFYVLQFRELKRFYEQEKSEQKSV